MRGPLVAALCVWTAWLFATPFCYGQCPLHLPAKCQPIANEVKALQAERNDLQAELKQAAGSQKGAIAGQIKNLLSQIAVKQKQVDSCVMASGKVDLSATIKGTVSLAVRLDPKSNIQDWQSEPIQPVSIQLTYLHWVHDQIVVKGLTTVEYKLLGTRPPG